MFTLIKHPNACPFYGAFTPPKNENSGDVKLLERPLILMPLFKNGSLADYINARKQTLIDNKLFGKRQVIDNMTLFNMAINASCCILFLHSRSIIHRDIKPENFLLDDNFVIRVTDFGVSRAMADISKGEYTYSGTEVWMAPEVFDKFYDHKVDVYSFGLVLWTMITGKRPYDKYDDIVTFTSVISNGLREKIPEFTPPVYPELAQLILKCWDADHKRRPEFKEIFESLCNMKLSLTQRPFTHLFYSLEEKEYHQLLVLLFSFMDSRTRISFSLTNSKFYQIFSSIDNVKIRM